MSNASFLELQVLQAINNGQRPEAERLVGEMSLGERNLFVRLLQDTLDLLQDDRPDCSHVNRVKFRSSLTQSYVKCLDCGKNLGEA